jgi:hypothetical protein
MKNAILLSSLLLFPAFAEACTVCFGGASGNLSRGFFWGIVLLGSLPFMMIAFFVTYLVRATRKKNAR